MVICDLTVINGDLVVICHLTVINGDLMVIYGDFNGDLWFNGD